MGKIYRDWKPEARIKAWARRHGLTAIQMNPPHEAAFLRVWFDKDNPEHTRLEADALKRYGHTRGGHTG